jgi:outer membrane protein assembly factor BamB
VYDLDVGFAGSGVVGRQVELDAQTGSVVGSFLAEKGPAFDGVLGFFLSGGTLRATVPPTDLALWGFAGDGSLNTAPVVAGGHVYVAGSSGMLFAVNELTGAQEWSQSLGATPPSSCGTCPISGLAIGEGLLVAPMGTRLIAFTSTTAPG